jgi:peptidoglycan/LPS O-acetylase OafA/YrhL
MEFSRQERSTEGLRRLEVRARWGGAGRSGRSHHTTIYNCKVANFANYMNISNPVFAVALTLLAFLAIKGTFLFEGKSPPPMRFATINGLRGYLALFVMLHHACMWFVLVHTGKWDVPRPNLYGPLGQASVLMFFMITSFLFYDKLLNARERRFDWKAFFIGRFFRIAPLYYVVLIFVFLTVAYLSDWRVVDSPQVISIAVAKWLLFTIPTAAPLNGHTDSWIIMAGVTWSLRYEWCFYLALPLISLAVRQRPGWLLLLVSVAALFIGWRIGLNSRFAAVFLGGILAAYLVRDPRFTRFCEKKIASVLVLLCFAAALQFDNLLQIAPCIALITAFCVIAGGADMFGLFSLPTSHRLGELAYGIYLIHGIVLFVAINFVVGKDVAADMAVSIYWMFIAVLALITLALSGMAYHYIEKPGIALGKRLGKRST